MALDPDPACRKTIGAPAPLASPKLSWYRSPAPKSSSTFSA